MAAVGVAVAEAAANTGPQACFKPGAPIVEPYRWYPKLDLARIPFHTAEGAWGPRAAVVAPEPPVTRRTVRVTSATQLAAEALVQGTTIVVDAEYIGPVVIYGDVIDVDLVVPPGRRIAQITVGRYTPRSTTQRFRLRGTTPGTHSGGLVGTVTFASNPTTDIIIDGVDLNGDNGRGGNLLWYVSSPTDRVAIVNVRGHAVGQAVLLAPGVTNIVIAGNRLVSGARSREANGYPEGWGIRGGDRIVVFDNRIDGNRYHKVRVEAREGPPQYAWVADNVFVDPAEARIFVAGGAQEQAHRITAVWAICNRVYAHSTCMQTSFEAPLAAYAVLTSNTFFGSTTEALQRSLQAAHGSRRDYLAGNTYSPWRRPPSWEAPGDPTATVPLPPVMIVRDKVDPIAQNCKPPPS